MRSHRHGSSARYGSSPNDFEGVSAHFDVPFVQAPSFPTLSINVMNLLNSSSTNLKVETNRITSIYNITNDDVAMCQFFFAIIDHEKKRTFVLRKDGLPDAGSMGVSNSFYGSKLFLNDELPKVAAYIERMNAANVELTQVVSQMSGSMVLSVADDLLQTPRMTIEELIESTQKCYGSVLAWACEFRYRCRINESLSDILHPPTNKPVGKRSADVDEGDVTTSKETKLPCVKIEGAK
ncbi:uncharacterized protein LOC123920150 isoform X2 [Trifolium pratense]|uniref:uncharacterized protein LOC123920150 isoform X2 n=1 Tax=Trifolium pratense TaxID=57577 RepID=UPI001E6964E1|nr:uncharacterized protein LOC123920150 isoform X2 [Trifolium pratense]XP_045828281.1 uncharacterized protein LOC123920150 isoform X2 [Trifolium pratense]